MKWKSAIILGFAFSGIGLAEVPKVSKAKPNQAVLLEPGSMLAIEFVNKISVVSLGYERQFGNSPISFQLHLHGAFSEDDQFNDHGDSAWAAGAGLTLRIYLGKTPEGSFVQVQSDFVSGEFRGWADPGNFDLSPLKSTTREWLLSLTHVGIGYKWAWQYFVMEAGVGGGLYFTQSEEFTSVAVTFNVGAPF